MVFGPKRIEIAAAAPLPGPNNDQLVHTVTADDGSWGSGAIEPGKSWSHTFTQPGEYAFHCTPHPFMKAVVVVSSHETAHDGFGRCRVRHCTRVASLTGARDQAPARRCRVPVTVIDSMHYIVALRNFAFHPIRSPSPWGDGDVGELRRRGRGGPHHAVGHHRYWDSPLLIPGARFSAPVLHRRGVPVPLHST